ncbi:MAG: FG-GAP-like repeat-containing protein [Woeseiaceae bacterium]|nr:FG-GAP-like repeat-containing protein [Woeseiaceae bacterium]
MGDIHRGVRRVGALAGSIAPLVSALAMLVLLMPESATALPDCDLRSTSPGIDGRASDGPGIEFCDDGIPPPTPNPLSVPSSDSDGSYRVSWGYSPGATRYLLQESSNGSNWTQIYSGGATARNISGKSSGRWYYRVRACNATWDCSYYTPVRSVLVTISSPTPPPIPSSISAPSSDADGSFRVSWGSSSGATSYRLQRQTNSGSWSTIQTSSLRYRDEVNLADATYRYRVSACNSYGCSNNTGTRTVNVSRPVQFPPAPPPPPAAPPTPNSGDVIGHTMGMPDVSATGEGTYSIPIFTPPGINGLKPELALTYGHRQGESIAGVGWSITGLSQITRCQKTVAQNGFGGPVNLTRGDRYCLDGNQLKHVSGSYGYSGSTYRTEIDMIARVTMNGSAGEGPAWFKVESKDGLIYHYGDTTNSRIESLALGKQSTARAWALSKVTDRSGNEIRYSYYEDGAPYGDYRISNIDYRVNPSAGLTYPGYSIRFYYQNQPVDDVDTGYQSDGVVEDRKRLTSISVNAYGASAYYARIYRRYNLTYETNLSSAKRSRLRQVQECAGSNYGMSCLEPTTFTYQNGQSGFGHDIGLGLIIPSGTKPLLLDINGDGRTDIIYPSAANNGQWYYHLANTSGSFGYRVSTGISSNGHEEAIGFDYNADGIDDILVPHSGNTWWAIRGSQSGLQSPVNTNVPDNSRPGDAIALDMNADGMEDLVWGENTAPYQSNARIMVRYNQGGSFSSTSSVVYQFPFVYMLDGPRIFDGTHAQDRRDAYDINGDGYKDVVVPVIFTPPQGAHQKQTMIIRGGGLGTTFAGNNNNFVTPADINGDGYTDFALLAYWNNTTPSLGSRLSTGKNVAPKISGAGINGLDLNKAISLDWDSDGLDDVLLPSTTTNTWYYVRSIGTRFHNVSVYTPMATYNPRSVHKVDVNGDGMLDLGYVKSNGEFGYRAHKGLKPDLLLTATDGDGNRVTFSYAPLSDASVYQRYYDVTTNKQDFAEPMYVVKRMNRTTGSGGTYNADYTYAGAKRSLDGRGLAGFHKKTMVDSRSGNKVIEFYELDFPYRTKLDKTELRTSANILVREIDNTWSMHQRGSGNERYYYPYLSATSERNFQAAGVYRGDQINEITTSYSVDTWGTVTNKATITSEHADGNGLQPGRSYYEQTLLSSINNNTYTWCFGKPGRVEYRSSHSGAYGGNIARTTQLGWDLSTRCRNTQVIVEPSSSTYKVTTTLGYDSFGNTNSRTVTGVNMASRTTSWNFGSTGQFMVSETNALSQTTSYTWDMTGDLLSVTDPNQLSRRWKYDYFGRMIQELRADATYTDYSFTRCSSSDSYCGTYNLWAKSKIRGTTKSPTGSIVRYDDTYIDSLDRTVQRSEQSLTGGMVNQRVSYDAFGRITTRWLPTYLTTPTKSENIAYDSLGRVYQISTPVNDSTTARRYTTITYEGLTVSTYDPEGRTTKKVSDALGRVYRSIDDSGFYQQFDYDGFGSLRRVTDSTGATLSSATYAYGLQPFKRNVNDMNLGNWTYYPNALGENTSHRDAKGRTFYATFDKLSRPLTRAEAEGTTRWTWGTSSSAKNIGKLQSVVSPGYSESYLYDRYGRHTRTTTTTDATYYMDYTYDVATGGVAETWYPVSTGNYRFRTRNEYAYGLLKRVRRADSGYTYWQANSADALGNIIDETLYNGIRTIRSYDGVTNNLDYIQSGVGGGTGVQNMVYDWDRVGNLTRRRDLNKSLDERFYYDRLYRLDRSTLNGSQNLDLSYYANGNIRTKSDVGGSTWTYHSTKRHAVVNASGNTYAYDANGNMTSRAGSTITWTSYNYPSVIREGSQRHEYSYGPDRQKWKQVFAITNGSIETTIYMGGIYEKNVRGASVDHRHYIMAAGRAVAMYTRPNNGIDYHRYILTDHQGSTAAITRPNGSVEMEQSFSAFGERRDPRDWRGAPPSSDLTTIGARTDMGYTGHHNLERSSLVHMKGRVFDARIGRSLSADPIVPDPMATQSYNRYSYVYNNPMTYVDPTGHCGEAISGYVCASIVATVFNFISSWFGGSDKPPPPNWEELSGPIARGEVAVQVMQFGNDSPELPNAGEQTPDVESAAAWGVSVEFIAMIKNSPGPMHSDLGLLGHEVGSGIDLADPAVIAESNVNQMLGELQAMNEYDDYALIVVGGATAAPVIIAYGGPVLVQGGRAVLSAGGRGLQATREFVRQNAQACMAGAILACNVNVQDGLVIMSRRGMTHVLKEQVRRDMLRQHQRMMNELAKRTSAGR